MGMHSSVIVKEVGPRDGLQNEPFTVPTDQKVEWINLLSKTGLSYIEVTSFVNPKWIPQLADALEVARSFTKNPDVTYAALVPNQRGLENALLADVDEVSVFMSASETHNLKNINKSIQDTYPILEKVIIDAQKANKKTRGYVSTVFGCPYEGSVEIDHVLTVCEKLFEMGVYELSLGDTIGVANPKQTELVLNEIKKRYSDDRIALHFHDTRGMALANILTAMQLGFKTFDASLGGLGGCPYAPGASGNVATDDLVHMLNEMGIHTGVNEELLNHAAQYIESVIQRPLMSKQSLLGKQASEKESGTC